MELPPLMREGRGWLLCAAAFRQGKGWTTAGPLKETPPGQGEGEESRSPKMWTLWESSGGISNHDPHNPKWCATKLRLRPRLSESYTILGSHFSSATLSLLQVLV